MLTRLSILRLLCCCVNFLYAMLHFLPPLLYLLYLLFSLKYLILTQVSLFNILYQLSCIHLLAIPINSSLSYLIHCWFPSLLILPQLLVSSLDSSIFLYCPMLTINTIIQEKLFQIICILKASSANHNCNLYTTQFLNTKCQ